MTRLRAVVAVMSATLSPTLTAMAETIFVPLGGNIQVAIDSAAVGDTIQLDAGVFEITEQLVTTRPLTIVGAGDADPRATTIIDAGRRCRIIESSADLELRHLELRNGMVGFEAGLNNEDDSQGDPDGDPCEFDGGDYGSDTVGGAIRTSGPLTLQQCTITGCRASFKGGAIYTENRLTLIECNLSDNAARAGGGIYSDAEVEVAPNLLSGCLIDANHACRGAVLFCRNPSQLVNSTIINCEGNALLAGSVVGRPVTVESSIICDNKSAGLDFGGLQYRIDEATCICRSLEDDDGDGIPNECEGQDHSIAAMIQAAIDAGETEIQLPPGDFQLAAPLALGIPERRLTIRGAPDGGTRLSGRSVVPIALLPQGLAAPYALADLTLADGFGAWGGGASLYYGELECRNVSFENCVASQGGGLFAYTPTTLTLLDSDFTDCQATNGSAFAYLSPFISYGSSEIRALNVDLTENDNLQSDSVVWLGALENDKILFSQCNWDLASSTDTAAIWLESNTGNSGIGENRLEQCSFEYGSATREVIVGDSLWHTIDCYFSSCCPFSDIASIASSTGSGNLWRCDDCVGDVTCDRQVDPQDLGRLLAAWGSSEERFDLDGDGIVRSPDLGVLLATWGACD